MLLKKTYQLVFFCSALLFGACSSGSNDYYKMVPLEKLFEDPKSYIGQRIEFVGYAYSDDITPSLSVYIDKESSEEPFIESVVYLVTDSLKQNKKLKKCSGNRVMAFGVFKPHSDIGFMLHIDKGVRVINEKGEVKDYCYKAK